MKLHNGPFTIAEGESLTGFHLRCDYIANHANLVDNIRHKDDVWQIAAYPHRLLPIPNYQLDLHHLLSKHTAFPLHKLCSKSTFKLEMLRFSMKIVNRTEVFAMLHKFSRWSELKFCPDCFKAQIQQYGYNWLLRDWNLPLVECCSVHKKILISYQCLCRKISSVSLLSNLFSGLCNKCYCDVWLSNEPKRASRKQSQIEKWVSELASMPAFYLTNAAQRRLLEVVFTRVNVSSRSERLRVEAVANTYFHHLKSYKDSKVNLEIRRWTECCYPLSPEIILQILMKVYKKPIEFMEFLRSTGQEGYIDNYLLAKKKDLCETYNFFDSLDFNINQPRFNGDGRYLKLIL